MFCLDGVLFSKANPSKQKVSKITLKRRFCLLGYARFEKPDKERPFYFIIKHINSIISCSLDSGKAHLHT